jgi:hypothetical protein
MRKTLIFLVLIFLCTGAAAPARAGEEEVENKAVTIIERVKEAIALPRAAKESREAGAAEDKVREVLEAARSRGIPAGETSKILEVENEELRKGGNPDNFGAAVHQLKASGLRGRELAKAIHAEQVARGMKPSMKAKHGVMAKHKEHGGQAAMKGAETAQEAKPREMAKHKEATRKREKQ